MQLYIIPSAKRNMYKKIPTIEHTVCILYNYIVSRSNYTNPIATIKKQYTE
jgi:hypothetical protein